LLVLGFVGSAAGVFPRSPVGATGAACLGLVGVAYVASAIFPCDPGCPTAGSLSQSIHNLFGFLEYLGAIAGLLLLRAAFRGDATWRPLERASGVCAALVALGFGAMLLAPLAVRGVSQRIAEAAIFGWIAYASVRLALR
jgi:hypothetical protein